jgi:hypothetical protein
LQANISFFANGNRSSLGHFLDQPLPASDNNNSNNPDFVSEKTPNTPHPDNDNSINENDNNTENDQIVNNEDTETKDEGKGNSEDEAELEAQLQAEIAGPDGPPIDCISELARYLFDFQGYTNEQYTESDNR